MGNPGLDKLALWGRLAAELAGRPTAPPTLAAMVGAMAGALAHGLALARVLAGRLAFAGAPAGPAVAAWLADELARLESAAREIEAGGASAVTPPDCARARGGLLFLADGDRLAWEPRGGEPGGLLDASSPQA
jgi:hypothetical protein